MKSKVRSTLIENRTLFIHYCFMFCYKWLLVMFSKSILNPVDDLHKNGLKSDDEAKNQIWNYCTPDIGQQYCKVQIKPKSSPWQKAKCQTWELREFAKWFWLRLHSTINAKRGWFFNKSYWYSLGEEMPLWF